MQSARRRRVPLFTICRLRRSLYLSAYDLAGRQAVRPNSVNWAPESDVVEIAEETVDGVPDWVLEDEKLKAECEVVKPQRLRDRLNQRKKKKVSFEEEDAPDEPEDESEESSPVEHRWTGGRHRVAPLRSLDYFAFNAVTERDMWLQERERKRLELQRRQDMARQTIR